MKLIPENHPGVPEVKWCSNRFTPFLSLDPKVRGFGAMLMNAEFSIELQYLGTTFSGFALSTLRCIPYGNYTWVLPL